MPEPLHPAIVHFPIAFAFLLPFVAAALLWAIHSGRLPARAWLAVLALQAAVLATGWLAEEQGEHDEERVERVVGEEPVEEHEEAAERFMLTAGVTLALAAAGLLGGTLGGIARGLTLVASLAMVAAVAAAGHTGGELVYEHGAALAYAQPDSAGAAATGSHRDHEDDDRDDD